MCLQPILIPNPNLGYRGYLWQYKDTTSRYIPVPCRHCTDCIATRQSSYLQRCLLEEWTGHPFYCTLTYNEEALPILTTSQGYDIRFPDWHDLHICIKRLEKYFSRKFSYLFVSELGELRGRPHFHGLIFVRKEDSDTFSDILNLEKELFDKLLYHWSRNVGTNRKPIYKPNLTYMRYYTRSGLRFTYDLHFVHPSKLSSGVDDVSYYVTKYMFKLSTRESRLQQALHMNLDPEEYESVWKIARPRVFMSKHFGLSALCHRAYVDDCILRSYDSDFPCFFNPSNGKSMPLSRYYQNKCLTVDDWIHFRRNNPKDNVFIIDYNRDKIKAQDAKRERLASLFDLEDSSIFNY